MVENKKSHREKIREKILYTREKTKKFNLEIKKSMNTAIVAAFGFLMALAWRDVITEYINEITSISPVQGKLISAIIITLIGVIG